MTFRVQNFHHGRHHGQDDFTMIAYEDERAVGYVDYSIFEDELHIGMVEVRQSRRRRGVGRRLIQAVADENPEVKAFWPGMTTDEGDALMRSYGKNPESGEAFMAIYDDEGVIDQLTLDDPAIDLWSPVVRRQIYRMLLGLADQGATTVQFWEGREGTPTAVVDTIHFRDFDLRTREGLDQLHEVLFGVIDDLAPPPRSSVRPRARASNRRRRRRRA